MNGLIKGSVIHIHRARTVIVDTNGRITASEFGNRGFSLQLLSSLLNKCIRTSRG